MLYRPSRSLRRCCCLGTPSHFAAGFRFQFCPDNGSGSPAAPRVRSGRGEPLGGPVRLSSRILEVYSPTRGWPRTECKQGSRGAVRCSRGLDGIAKEPDTDGNARETKIARTTRKRRRRSDQWFAPITMMSTKRLKRAPPLQHAGASNDDGARFLAMRVPTARRCSRRTQMIGSYAAVWKNLTARRSRACSENHASVPRCREPDEILAREIQ